MYKNSEFIPTKIDSFLSETDYTFVKEQIDKLLSNVENKYDGFYIHQNGMHQYEMINSDVSKIFAKTMEEYFGREVVENTFFFARYTSEEGNSPALPPHLDNYGPLSNHPLTFTYVLDYSLDWDICVMDKCSKMNKNDIIVFSGSNHAHWRPRIIFNDSDFYDIFVMHFTFKDSEKEVMSKDYLDIMKDERSKYMGYWEQSSGGKMNSNLV